MKKIISLLILLATIQFANAQVNGKPIKTLVYKTAGLADLHNTVTPLPEKQINIAFPLCAYVKNTGVTTWTKGTDSIKLIITLNSKKEYIYTKAVRPNTSDAGIVTIPKDSFALIDFTHYTTVDSLHIVGLTDTLEANDLNILTMRIKQICVAGTWNNISSNDTIVNLFFLSQKDVSVLDPSFQDVKIYPNPTKDFVKLETLTENTNVNIYTLTGQLAQSHASLIGEQTLDLSGLSSGMYILKLQSGTKTRTVKVQVIK